VKVDDEAFRFDPGWHRVGLYGWVLWTYLGTASSAACGSCRAAYAGVRLWGRQGDRDRTE
jgi:hypothetical protein